VVGMVWNTWSVSSGIQKSPLIDLSAVTRKE
jgi:hypothetical protein